MRIIGGKFGGKLIKPPKGLPVRPTTDLAKEALFNILENRINFADSVILDCFAGTGSMSYEFISRGCTRITTVDQDKRCTDFIKLMFAELGLPKGIVVKYPVEKFLKATATPYDLIFMDPPYDMPKQADLVTASFKLGWAAPGATLILEHASQNDFSHLPYFYEVRKYGGTSFSFFSEPEPK